MSQKLIDHNQDLKRLQDKGYCLEIEGGFLCVSDIPYVNEQKQVVRGKLITSLELMGNKTTRPGDHRIYFCGEYPCNRDGSPIESIRHASGDTMLANGLKINHTFSNKPQDGYRDYYEKVTTYANILEHQAREIDPDADARTFKPIKASTGESPFHFVDTNSSRAEIGEMSERLQNLKIGIVGLGGTGSYVLDFVSKTPVKEIHLFDDDVLLQHNAFRMPGVSAFGALDKRTTKVNHLSQEYSKMRSGIVKYQKKVTSRTRDDISGMDFVFLCIDDSTVKKGVIQKLVKSVVPFIDVGVGIEKESIDGTPALMGAVRVTMVTGTKKDHIERHISLSSDDDNDEYSRNIQIAEINALNAALAVIKWKKMYGFYFDQAKENHSVYDISMNQILNDEIET